MHSIKKPDTDFEELFYRCSGRTKAELKENLNKKFYLIDTAVKAYNYQADKRKLFEIKPICQNELKPITGNHLQRLYTYQMVRKRGLERDNYDAIIASAKKYCCCFCSHEVPTEIDHFLPKSKFPEFSILPTNLVPCCNRCNKLKANDSPISAEESYIHPYFEDYSTIIWLEAVIDFDENSVPNINYCIARNLTDSDIVLAKKIEYQFKKLQLNKRYSHYANSEISQIEHRLKLLRVSTGVNGVRMHLQEEAISRSNFNRNSWQGALYNCLYQNDDFCEVTWKL